MKYLYEYGFTENEIVDFIQSIPNENYKPYEDQEKLVKANYTFLRDLGISNAKEIFLNYSGTFLMDHTEFKDKFLKYDVEDLKEKLLNNIKIIPKL